MQRHGAVSVHVAMSRRPGQRMVRSIPQRCHVCVKTWSSWSSKVSWSEWREMCNPQGWLGITIWLLQGTRHFRERVTWESKMSHWQMTLLMPPFLFLPHTPHKRWTVSQGFPIPGIPLANRSSDFWVLVKLPKPTQWNVGLTRMKLTALSLGRACCRVVNHTRYGPWGTYVPNSCPTPQFTWNSTVNIFPKVLLCSTSLSICRSHLPLIKYITAAAACYSLRAKDQPHSITVCLHVSSTNQHQGQQLLGRVSLTIAILQMRKLTKELIQVHAMLPYSPPGRTFWNGSIYSGVLFGSMPVGREGSQMGQGETQCRPNNFRQKHRISTAQMTHQNCPAWGQNG